MSKSIPNKNNISIQVIHVARADSIGDERVPRCSIHVTDKIPECNKDDWQEFYNQFYDQQAQSICDALTNSLPSAVRIRLISMLLKQEADKTFLRVNI